MSPRAPRTPRTEPLDGEAVELISMLMNRIMEAKIESPDEIPIELVERMTDDFLVLADGVDRCVLYNAIRWALSLQASILTILGAEDNRTLEKIIYTKVMQRMTEITDLLNAVHNFEHDRDDILMDLSNTPRNRMEGLS